MDLAVVQLRPVRGIEGAGGRSDAELAGVSFDALVVIGRPRGLAVAVRGGDEDIIHSKSADFMSCQELSRSA